MWTRSKRSLQMWIAQDNKLWNALFTFSLLHAELIELFTLRTQKALTLIAPRFVIERLRSEEEKQMIGMRNEFLAKRKKILNKIEGLIAVLTQHEATWERVRWISFQPEHYRVVSWMTLCSWLALNWNFWNDFHWKLHVVVDDKGKQEFGEFPMKINEILKRL